MARSLEFHLRRSRVSDGPLLREALALALLWRRPDPPGDFDAALRRSGHRWLLEDWGREGDCGVIAEGGGRFLGAAWYRCWTDERHSYGFVAPEVPEMGIGLHHGWRGQGVGGALIAALCRCAVEAGVAGLSLSVEVDNPARRLYLRHGFADHGQVEGAVTMMKDLSPDPDEGPGRGEELPWSLTLSPC